MAEAVADSQQCFTCGIYHCLHYHPACSMPTYQRKLESASESACKMPQSGYVDRCLVSYNWFDDPFWKSLILDSGLTFV
jgi:hypothetical protein